MFHFVHVSAHNKRHKVSLFTLNTINRRTISNQSQMVIYLIISVQSLNQSYKINSKEILILFVSL